MRHRHRQRVFEALSDERLVGALELVAAVERLAAQVRPVDEVFEDGQAERVQQELEETEHAGVNQGHERMYGSVFSRRVVTISSQRRRTPPT